jgi:hypothetical protein
MTGDPAHYYTVVTHAGPDGGPWFGAGPLTVDDVEDIARDLAGSGRVLRIQGTGSEGLAREVSMEFDIPTEGTTGPTWTVCDRTGRPRIVVSDPVEDLTGFTTAGAASVPVFPPTGRVVGYTPQPGQLPIRTEYGGEMPPAPDDLPPPSTVDRSRPVVRWG